jgi:hypothetical protein
MVRCSCGAPRAVESWDCAPCIRHARRGPWGRVVIIGAERRRPKQRRGRNGSASTCGTQTCIAAENAAALCGCTNRRLPTCAELVGIVESRCARPALNTKQFTIQDISMFWTSTTGPGNTHCFVDFTVGSDAVDNPNVPTSRRLVRSATGAHTADGFE